MAEEEYKLVWMGTTKPNARQVYRGLSRYYDINVLNDLAEAESGWDMTPRFGRKALSYVPIDLNSLLYKYEMDFARLYKLLDDPRKAAEWEVAGFTRSTARLITQLDGAPQYGGTPDDNSVVRLVDEIRNRGWTSHRRAS